MYVHMCNGTIYSSPCVCVYSLSKKKISDFLSVLSGFEVGMGIVDVFAEHSKRFKWVHRDVVHMLMSEETAATPIRVDWFRSNLLRRVVTLVGDGG